MNEVLMSEHSSFSPPTPACPKLPFLAIQSTNRAASQTHRRPGAVGV